MLSNYIRMVLKNSTAHLHTIEIHQYYALRMHSYAVKIHSYTIKKHLYSFSVLYSYIFYIGVLLYIRILFP